MYAYEFISSQIAFGILSGRLINFELETKRKKQAPLRRRLISRSVVFILILTHQPWQLIPNSYSRIQFATVDRIISDPSPSPSLRWSDLSMTPSLPD